MDKYLNIVSFNIPFPANYGGIIDVFYKIKALHEAGVKIILHCFQYERPAAPELEQYCEKVYYYKRHTGLLANMTLLPYNVYSRKDPELLRNLLKNDYPILFEGLHSCYYMSSPELKNRKKIYREANIEHDYYFALGKAEVNLIKKAFFFIEAFRFRAYQDIIKYADRVIAVSEADTDYLKKMFPSVPVTFMPCYHENNKLDVEPGQSDFILYHGKLSVVENEKAVLYLIHEVFSKLKHKCIIAGMDPSPRICKAAAPFPNIQIIKNPDKPTMDRLIREAQIHLLITFQGTGLKLKLLNSLFAGRHIVVNSCMLTGSGLDPLCHIADTPEEMIQTCNRLMGQHIDMKMIDQRASLLFPTYSNKDQAQKLIKLVF